MRKLKIIEYVSLDGVIEDPGPSGSFKHRGWTVPYWDDEMAAAQSEQLFASDALLLGRVTYDEFVAAWPLRSGDPFTDKMNSMKKYVASHDASRQFQWNATRLNGEAVDSVTKLKREPGDDILVYGSRTLVHELLPQGLIDEYRLIVYPLILGEGKRLFKDGARMRELKLVNSMTTRKGVTLLTYVNR